MLWVGAAGASGEMRGFFASLRMTTFCVVVPATEELSGKASPPAAVCSADCSAAWPMAIAVRAAASPEEIAPNGVASLEAMAERRAAWPMLAAFLAAVSEDVGAEVSGVE